MIAELDSRLQRKQGERDTVIRQLADAQGKLSAATNRQQHIEEAQQVLQLVAQKTQEGVVLHISDIVTAALDAVFEDTAYGFQIEFMQKRGKTEAELYFERGGERIDPMTASGGGPVDVAAFALRVALWSLLRRSSGIADTIVLDEPFRFLSRDLQSKAGQMLKMLSEKLGVQFIFVTHVQDLVDSADRVFEVSKRGKFSKVEVV
jgi:DNA repair exonuclease SbcCD ATPase subunit